MFLKKIRNIFCFLETKMFLQQMFLVRANGKTFRETMFLHLWRANPCRSKRPLKGSHAFWFLRKHYLKHCGNSENCFDCQYKTTTTTATTTTTTNKTRRKLCTFFFWERPTDCGSDCGAASWGIWNETETGADEETGNEIVNVNGGAIWIEILT